MKKRIFSIALTLAMLLSLIAAAAPALAAEDTITLRFHYYRPDGDYEGWNMWFWDPNGVTMLAPPYQFVEENGDMVATVQLETGTTSVGYIIRYGEREAKGIESDQFIDLTELLSSHFM